jgi:aryl-alcohol dehydrogenase-like predicted oxidoreductase
MEKAFDCGINVLDTANVYTQGKSEAIIGKAIKGRRDDVIIATKVGNSISHGPNQSGLSRKHILWQLRKSLTRLETDFIDLYYLHRFDSDTPLEETLRTLNDLVRAGTVRYIACSNFTAEQIAQAHVICEAHDLERFIAVQPPYSLLQRDAEDDLLPYCQREKLGVLTYSPLRGGLLSGKYLKNASPPPGSRAEYNPRFRQRVTMANFMVLEQIETVARNADLSMPTLALSWILTNPRITAPIVGASSPTQVEENCRIAEIRLDEDFYRLLDTITAR